MIDLFYKIEPFLIYGIIKGFLFALLAVGFCLFYKTTKIFHIAYGLIYTSASYFAIFFIEKVKTGIPISLILALLFTSLIGLSIEKLVYFPLRKRRAASGSYLVSSIGVYVIGINVISLIFGNKTRILSLERGGFSIHGISLTKVQLYQFTTSFLLLVVFFFFLKKSRMGNLITALADNPTLFQIFGWSEKSTRSATVIISSIFGGIASLLFTFDVGINPHVGMNALLISAVAMIIGGVKNLRGSALAGIGLGIIQGLVAWQISARWEDAVTFLILTVYLLIFRKKIVGRVRVEEYGPII